MLVDEIRYHSDGDHLSSFVNYLGDILVFHGDNILTINLENKMNMSSVINDPLGQTHQ